VTTAEKYVSAAYLVFLAVLLVYLVICSAKVARLEREVAELTQGPSVRADLLDTRAQEEERALVA
jgi:cytochrome c biogenesis protein ResB